MEVFIPSKTSHCPETSISGGSSATDPHNLIQNKENLSMTDLKTCLTELMNVEQTRISTGGFNLAPEKNDISTEVRESECKDSEKCLSKSATFPPPRVPKLSGEVFAGEKGKPEEDVTYEVSDGNGLAKTFDRCYSRSTSLPVPLKLVSAMKGSREKQQGTPSPKKLSVTWAPDVYDPIPTSVSHVPSDKNQRYRNKKYGKYNKQKSSGKSSRGSKSKDSKKQGRNRSGGGSSKLKQPFHVEGGVILGEPPQVGPLDYNNVGSPDPFCGSSFLKQSVTKLHYPVAEAT
ncbi:hypothetical protein PHJA_001979300 [Phtheirospermum japonicum]|uniref:Uncharacterized protein n=1 Tax=Phtheirospermum japonicum TaxID=374723 RepID=A0A830CQE9_9LAMI|nr:hypothetical protein PHJA_001979300 [Phtheirospermum japonicum]